MLNFLYAFDRNYTTQGCVSIYSLLENVEEKINIFVILDSSNENYIFPEKISHHKNLNNFIVKDVEVEERFYNISSSHVSKATFYRLYLSFLFEREDIVLTYLDADIICVSNPVKEITSIIKTMEAEEQAIAFADEFYRRQNDEPFLRLNMHGEKYFNAGVMVVDLMKWKSKNYSKKSLTLIEALRDKAQFWDQDILNSLIDGDYITIDKNLNHRTSGIGINKKIKGIVFIHFSGKSKPWDVGGIFEEFASIYHKYYEKLFQKKFHVTSRNRKNSLRKLLYYKQHYSLISKSDFIKYILYSILAIFKK
ncbi:hypothetical protein N9T02_00980 [Candidatus Actinomarina]|mgnify:CR=1 FL=1|nr:hypothetical protein [Candidatus Actinomarina sp.]|tara:strand:- start:2251 stop:3174 length:924 start_codon:yes stop_codon:yes gene_type:complete